MSWAAKTPIIVLSRNSRSPKYTGALRRTTAGAGSATSSAGSASATGSGGSTSRHDARITSGTSTPTSMSRTSAMPSTANVNRASQVGIHWYDSRNWNREPLAWKDTYMTTMSAVTARDQTSASRLASSGRYFGTSDTTRPPTAGATVRTLRYGKVLIRA